MRFGIQKEQYDTCYISIVRLAIQTITTRHMLYSACDEIWYSKNNSTAHVVRISIQKITTLHMCVRIHFILCMVIFSLYSSKENISFWELYYWENM